MWGYPHQKSWHRWAILDAYTGGFTCPERDLVWEALAIICLVTSPNVAPSVILKGEDYSLRVSFNQMLDC